MHKYTLLDIKSGFVRIYGMTMDDLRETAALAHLSLGEAELAAAFPAFEQILGYFAAMQAADEDENLFPKTASGPSAPAGQNAGAGIVGSGHFRTDDAGSEKSAVFSGDLNENLLNNSGERDGRFLVIPNVL
jgi:aspartyl-tRNA(Asn)/glutamyl-tRNA(Gln) amidotransferase subunit C